MKYFYYNLPFEFVDRETVTDIIDWLRELIGTDDFTTRVGILKASSSIGCNGLRFEVRADEEGACPKPVMMTHTFRKPTVWKERRGWTWGWRRPDQISGHLFRTWEEAVRDALWEQWKCS